MPPSLHSPRALLRPLALAAALCAAARCRAEPIGDVDTAFQWIGPDHKIVVEAYDDPKVAGHHLLRVARQDGRDQGRDGRGRGQGRGLDRLPAGRAGEHRQAAAAAGGGVQRTHEHHVQAAAHRAHGRSPAQHARLPDLLRPPGRRLAARTRSRRWRWIAPRRSRSSSRLAAPPERLAQARDEVGQAVADRLELGAQVGSSGRRARSPRTILSMRCAAFSSSIAPSAAAAPPIEWISRPAASRVAPAAPAR